MFVDISSSENSLNLEGHAREDHSLQLGCDERNDLVQKYVQVQTWFFTDGMNCKCQYVRSLVV